MTPLFITRVVRACVTAACGLVAVDASAATFTLSPPSLTFGNQVVDTTSTARQIILRNTANTTLVFTMTTSGDFAAADQCNGTVLPGKTCMISVTFRPAALGTRTGSIVFADRNQASNKLTEPLSGTGVLATTVTPASLAFGNVAMNTTSAGKTVTLKNNQDVALNNIALASSNPDYSAFGCPATLPARGSCDATVTFTPSAPAGTAENAILTITHSAAATSGLQNVNLSGTSVLPIALSASSLTFPSTFQGATSSTTLTLKNNLAVALNSVVLTTVAPFTATGCAPPVPAGGTCTITVTFAPRTVDVGSVNGLLTVSSPQASNQPTTALSGVAVRPVTVTPNLLDFGSVTVASTSGGNFVTITNNQTSQLTFGSPLITIGGASAGDYARASTTCTATLAAGASCRVTLTFHPTAGGPRPATLAINDNAFGNPQVISLTGIGTTPVTITPSSVAFGSVDVGLVSASHLVTLKNNQSVPVAFSSIATIGDFAKELTGTTCGTTLAAGASCVISLVMTPTAGGSLVGSLVITSNTSESPNVVALSGSGINAVTASVTSLAFASQPLSTTSSLQQAVLTNHQTTVSTPLNTLVSGDFAATDACGGVIAPSSTCAVSITFTPTVLGTRTGTATFNSPGGPPISISLSGTGVAATPPAVSSVSPGAGTLGTSVTGVVVTGNGSTNFASNSAVSFGDGITVSNVRSVSANSLTVDVAIASTATPGDRTVTITTPLSGGGSETASLSPGFVVSASASLSLASVTPDVAKQGQTLDVSIVGVNTHFQQGVTFANFAGGVLVNSLTVQDPMHATANVTVSPTTTLGWRPVTLATGGEQATLSPTGVNGPGFDVIAGDAALTEVTPNSGAQGANPFVVTLNGSSTHFLQGATEVSFGSGIDVGNVQVVGLTELTVSIAVTAGATVGLRDVSATTGGEVASLAGGFTVTPAPPPSLSSVSPNSGQQGASLSLTITGLNTHFTTDNPAPTLSLGSNITVSALTVVSDTTITADISIDFTASVGDRTAILSSGGTNFQFTFTVQPSSASIVNVSPANGPQGSAISITVTGQDTHWQQGTTTASFVIPGSCPVASVDRVTISSPITAALDLTIPANACVGAEAFQMATGGEVVGATFGVYRHTPSVGLSPSSGMVGTTLTVNFLGEFSHFVNGPTTAVIDGAGVSIQNFVVSSAASATGTFVVGSDALTGPRTVTLTTPLGGGANEILTTAFQVTSTPAVLTSIEPFHAAPGTTTSVTIRGSFTHFANGQTTVGFGPSISTGTPVVNSPTELTVDVSLDSAADVGWRSAFVNTGTEQLTIGFHVDGQAAPAIVEVSPSTGAQGQSPIAVTITGANTNFNGSSQLILGAGVTVADFLVTGPTTATATVSISPTAPVGPNTVIVITNLGPGQEIASGAGFSVRRGPSQIVSVTPSIAAQNQVLNVALVGQGTHWLQGGTSADFGPGVIVNQLTIADQTHATARIAVLSNAAPGFHTVGMLTDGEYVAMVQGLDIQQGAPTLVSSSPNVGAQATTFFVQVLGQLTHWQDQTTASYGAGVIVNSFTVTDSVSGVISVTIDPLAFVDAPPVCHSLTVTTGTEQVSLPNQLCVQPGAAMVTSVSPNAAPQGSTLTAYVTGQNTHFVAGLTTADFGAGINASNVTVTSPTTASVDLAVTSLATSGFHTASLQTLGETASMANAFIVDPNTPTLNGASPVAGQQGQILTVRLIGQYTHWSQGTTTVTFGQGIAVGTVTVIGAAALDVAIGIDSVALIGQRTVTVTTGGEIVSASVFSVVAAGAIISQVAPQSGNQGQDIVLAVTGQNTHWQQGLTQFSMSGAGGDLKVNYVLINSETSATAGITISPTAGLGARSIYMVTGAEALVDANAFIVTGGIPAIASVTPGSARAGATGVTVQFAGLYTHWLTGTTTVDFGPGITVNTLTVNSDTSLTAVLAVAVAAGLGGRTVTIRNVAQNVTQALTGYFQVVSNAPPVALISYLSPTSGLRGQTFTIGISGQSTHWDPTPNATSIDFGDPGTSGITINSFQVTSVTSARVNITIAPNATFGARTLSIAATTQTGTEVVQTTFTVVQATPALTIVDPSFGMQGATMTLNVIGQYTGFNDTTSFNFGSDVTVNSVTVLDATIAQVSITIAQLAAQGPRFVTATTDGSVVGGATFSVTPSQAVIVSLSPNTAKQQDTITVDVTGQNTNWNGTTVFGLGGAVDVTNAVVSDSAHATLTISVQPLAAVGAYSITATTGGEVASLTNAFVVQPGTPIILSSGPPSAAQQASVILTVLGRHTHWLDGTTTVTVDNGVTVDSVDVTTPTSITVDAHVDPLTILGPRTMTVTTGDQVLTLANALVVTAGPAVISQLSPSQAGQGDTLNVAITGTNTHFSSQNGTVANFGQGISVNSLSIQSDVMATANITVAANAAPGYNSVTLTTLGESASIIAGFTIQLTAGSIQFVTPTSGAQGTTLDVSVIGSLTAFDNTTTFDFGPDVTVNSKTIIDAAHATVNITISPVAARTLRNVSATTGGGTASGANLFTVTAGAAYISAVNPNRGRQEQNGLQITISGFLTHFTAGTPIVSLGQGVAVTQVVVDSPTQLRVTVNISPSAPVQFNDVLVTTLGEVATLLGGFGVQAFQLITPVITWATPADITYGALLSATQLNAEANVTGTFVYTPPAGTLLQAGAAQALSVTFTPYDTLHYQNATATVHINVAKAPQSTLVVIDAPPTAVNGTSFTVNTSGGSGNGVVTFNATGACSNTAGGALITMTSGTGTCSIVATKAADNNFLETTSAPALVTATAAISATLEVVSTTVGFAAAFPAAITVRLRGDDGGSVAAPSGGVTLSASSSDTACVVATSTVFTAGALSAAVPVSYGGAATLPCDATVTIASALFGSDSVTVRVYPAESVYSGSTALSYYNPAPVPNPAGVVVAGVASVSYYNPAPVPNPGGSVATSVASVSYYNPAPIPAPGGGVVTSVAAVSYYNPAPVPNPGGSVATSVAAVSYYNPAPIPDPSGTVVSGVAAVSYYNPASAQQQNVSQLAPESATARVAADAGTVATFSISLANGPTATALTPVRLSRTAGTIHKLTIYGASLTGATQVTFVGLGNGILVVGGPSVSEDGRVATVDVFVSPTAPLGLAHVAVSGAGWITAEVPNVRVEIVP